MSKFEEEEKIMEGILKKNGAVIAKVLDIEDRGYRDNDMAHGAGILQTGAIQFTPQVIDKYFPDQNSAQVMQFLGAMNPMELVVGSTVYTGYAVKPLFQYGKISTASIYYCDKK